MKIINYYLDVKKDYKLFKKRLKQIKILRIKFFLVCILGRDKIAFLRKNNVFAQLGKNVLYQPKTIPNDSQLIKIHNNVKIASDVTFYEHDVINAVLSKIDDMKYMEHLGCIEIFDNCFIGGKSIILGNVKIGPNAIVGAGSVVTKDVPPNSIVAGNPAKIVGNFDDLHKKRKEEDKLIIDDIKLLDRYEYMWNNFEKKSKLK